MAQWLHMDICTATRDAFGQKANATSMRERHLTCYERSSRGGTSPAHSDRLEEARFQMCDKMMKWLDFIGKGLHAHVYEMDEIGTLSNGSTSMDVLIGRDNLILS